MEVSALTLENVDNLFLTAVRAALAAKQNSADQKHDGKCVLQ